MANTNNVFLQPRVVTKKCTGNCPDIAPSAANICVMPVITAKWRDENKPAVTTKTETKAKAEPKPINKRAKQAINIVEALPNKTQPSTQVRMAETITKRGLKRSSKIPEGIC